MLEPIKRTGPWNTAGAYQIQIMSKNITQSHALALLFMNELLASVETLSGIAEQYGLPTLVNLMYL